MSADSGAFAVSAAIESDRSGGTVAATGREWLETLPGELSAQPERYAANVPSTMGSYVTNALAGDH